jgi:serine protease Do
MRWHITLISIAFWAPLVAQAQPDPAAYMQMARNIVRVEAVMPNGRTHMGTGVVLAPGLVMTNCHVTGAAEWVGVSRGGFSYPAQALRADWRHDLCMLQVRGVNGPPIHMGSTTTLESAQPVLAFGFTGGYELLFTTGQVRGLYTLDGGRVIKSSSPFTSGASGGGLFDESGNLIGILTFRLRNSMQHYYAMPVEWFANWMTSSEGFEPIGGAALQPPMWLTDSNQQPLFMQAASLEMTGHWQDLLRVAMAWTHDEENDPQAWLARGTAEAALGDAAHALEDMKRAVQIEPRLTEGWLGLVKLYQAIDRPQELLAAKARLAGLDEDLALDQK